MRILLVHTSYRQPGGEDIVARAEAALLRANGHDVDEYWRSNTELASGLGTIRIPFQALWSRQAIREIEHRLDTFQPDVVHFHNTWLMVSPGALHAVHDQGIPVVHTLHNYRLLCPTATFLRNGKPCELCKNRLFPWPGVRYGCYRQSRLQTAMLGTTVGGHRLLGTWQQKVDVYVALTDFARTKFIEGGLPPEKLVIKPNFLQRDPGPGHHGGGYALFVGRLSEEKGIDVMLEAWRHVPVHLPLNIVGDGPLADRVAATAAKHEHIHQLGRRPHGEVLRLMQNATLLIFPSICYEGFGLTIVEAYACGLPVIASKLGSMVGLIDDERTGLHVTPNDPSDLAAKVRWWLDHPEAHSAMQQAARATFEQRYTAEQNYAMLMDIYRTAIARAKDPSSSNAS